MNKLVIEKYCDFLDKTYDDYCKTTGCKGFKTKKTRSRFSIFGSYSNSHELVLRKSEDIEKYSQRIKVTTNKKNYINNGLIILRSYQGEKNLVIGCGNVLCDGNKFGYRKHENSYTIDPDIDRNPSVCCEFGKQKIVNIPDNAFENIICEGFYPEDPNKLTYFYSEILRMLKDGGYLWQCNDSHCRTSYIKKHNILVEIIIQNNNLLF